jgi:hypothetical protein
MAASAAAGVSQSATVRAVDAAGNTTAGYRGTIHFTSTDKRAILPHDYTFTASDSGSHTFTATSGIVLKTAGLQSVAAVDKVSAALTGARTSIAVAPGSATRLVVAAVGPFVAGDPQGVTVRAVDAYGNTATGYRGLDRFATSDTKATLPAAYRFTALDNGTRKFTLGLVLKTAGSQSIRVTDSVTASITATQTGLIVAPGAAKTFTVATTGLAVVNTARVVTVRALDAYGNISTGYRGRIRLASSDTRAHLPATYTFTAVDAGVHTFMSGSSVWFGTRGTEWLRASDIASASLTGAQTGIVVR